MRPLSRALAALALLLCARPASAQAWLGASTGTVEAAMVGQDHWTPLGRGVVPLGVGTHVRTAPDGTATLVFADHSRLRLDHGTEVSLDELGPKGSAVKLQNGALEAFAAKAAAPSLRLRTATAFASASDAEFSLGVSALKDTEVVVYGGVVTVRLQNGQSARFGEGQEFRSVLVVAGRALSLLPHPREDAGSKTKAAASAASAAVARDWPDCLHKKNGAIRDAIEDVAECQRRQRARLSKGGELTLEASSELRSHQQEELRGYARAKGWMPAGVDGEPDPAPSAETASGETAEAGTQAEAELGAAPGAGGALLSEKDQALLKQLQSGGGQVNPGALNMLFQALLEGNGLAPKAAGRPDPAP